MNTVKAIRETTISHSVMEKEKKNSETGSLQMNENVAVRGCVGDFSEAILPFASHRPLEMDSRLIKLMIPRDISRPTTALVTFRRSN